MERWSGYPLLVALLAVLLAVPGCAGTPTGPAGDSPAAASSGGNPPAAGKPGEGPPADASPGGPDAAGEPNAAGEPDAAGDPDATDGPGGRVGTAAPTAPAVPAFTSGVEPVTAADLGPSWRPGCPVAPDQLRRVRLGYWDFDGQSRLGTIVVHRAVTTDVIKVFATLYRQRFPIRRMQPVDAYGGSDDRSMAADNTSGFNCRPAVSTGARRWSAHAYGRAIDVNPVENPYLVAGEVLPPAGSAYRNRADHRPGMAVPDGVLVEAFTAVGWYWGGGWRSPDYQHFSSTGG